ncbi:MAG: DinB family protein [Chloroflexota bacterium]
MLNFAAVRDKETTMGELCADLTINDLRDLTNEMTDTVLNLMTDCVDADVVFVPTDPDAHDAAADNPDDTDLAWTLGHLVVHTAASTEESSFLSAELARGIIREGRSRYETPWETVTTLAQCRERLEDNRRMCLATLDVWPAEPHLDTTVTLGFLKGPLNPIARYCSGLGHTASHLEQFAEVIRQAKAARS